MPHGTKAVLHKKQNCTKEAKQTYFRKIKNYAFILLTAYTEWVQNQSGLFWVEICLFVFIAKSHQDAILHSAKKIICLWRSDRFEYWRQIAQLIEYRTRYSEGPGSIPGLFCHYFSHSPYMLLKRFLKRGKKKKTPATSAKKWWLLTYMYCIHWLQDIWGKWSHFMISLQIFNFCKWFCHAVFRVVRFVVLFACWLWTFPIHALILLQTLVSG